MRTYILIGLLLFALYACNDSNHGHVPNVLVSDTTKSRPMKVNYNRNAFKVLVSDTVYHEFSNVKEKDAFILTLTGDSIISGHMKFQILNHKGAQIYIDTFQAIDMIRGEEPLQIHTIKAKEDTIVKEMKQFVEQPFASPAIDSNLIFDPGIVDSVTWNEIKKDKFSVGFFYGYGYEGSIGITYSKRQNKVVIYFSED